MVISEFKKQFDIITPFDFPIPTEKGNWMFSDGIWKYLISTSDKEVIHHHQKTTENLYLPQPWWRNFYFSQFSTPENIASVPVLSLFYHVYFQAFCIQNVFQHSNVEKHSNLCQIVLEYC